MESMRYRILGPLEIRTASGWSPVRSPSLRVLLAVLLIRHGEVVTTQRLQNELWGERLPPTADKTLQVYISRLRRVLEDPAAVRTEPSGYRLPVECGQLDLHHFERLAEAGQRDLAAGNHQAAESSLTEALRLWRGTPLADARDTILLAAESARLHERRLSVQDSYCDVLLARRRFRELLPLLRAEAEANPLRESTWVRLLTALSADGRTSEALDAYATARSRIADELGTDPGPRMRELYQDLLAEGTVAAAPPRPTSQLPPQPPDFVGREALAGRIAEVLTERTRTGHPVVTLTGQPGVGKTALAVHLAHRLRDHFPGGQLYVNLRGYATATALTPRQALTRLLRMLGALPERVPADSDELEVEYRAALASRPGVLLVLDNVADADQVRPLLPVDPSSAAVITSRAELRGLTALHGARPFTVRTLTPEDSRVLLTDVLGAELVDGAEEAAAELAQLCGHLPLALRIAAANLLSRRGAGLHHYVGELRGSDRLAKLAVDGDRGAAVHLSFDLSYHGLPSVPQRLFRLLGLLAGADVTAYGAAALLDSTPEDAARSLDHLASVNLLQRHAGERYEFHDLLREYAGLRARTEGVRADNDAALRRLFEYYLRTVDAACGALHEGFMLVRLDRAVDRAVFADKNAARAWLRTELPNLLATVRHTAEHGPHELGCNLVDALRPYFWETLLGHEWLDVAEAGLLASKATTAPHVRAAMLLNHGAASACVGHFENAIDSLQQAVDTFHEAGSYEAVVAVLGMLGMCHLRSRRTEDAVEMHQEALRVCERTGQSRFWAVRCRLTLAQSSTFVDLRQADRYVREALELLREYAFPQVWGISMGTLGRIAEERGEYGAALNYDRTALTLFRQREKEYEQLNHLIALARVHCLRGEADQAAEVVRDAWPRAVRPEAGCCGSTRCSPSATSSGCRARTRTPGITTSRCGSPRRSATWWA